MRSHSHRYRTTDLTAAFVALVCTAAGCGGTLGQGATLRRATLEVVNRSPATQWIEVRGQVVGTVPSGERARIRELRPGRTEVLARPAPESEIRSGRFTGVVDLERGEVVVWQLAPEGTAIPEPPPLTELLVTSHLPTDTEITLDGRRLGAVLANDERTFADIPAGPHHLEAADAKRALVLSADVDLYADGSVRWVLEAPTTSLTVVNDTDEAVRAALDDGAGQRVEPGERHTWTDLPARTVHATAVATLTGRRYATALTLRADFPETWTLTAGMATVEIVNRSGEDIRASGLTDVTLEIPDGATETVGGLAPGDYDVSLTGQASGLAGGRRLTLGGDQRLRWTIPPTRPTVTVSNRTPWRLYVFADGQASGVLEAGLELVLTDLPEGEVSLRALTYDRKHAFERRLTPEAAALNRWEIRQAAGALCADNRRPEEMEVYVDAVRVGTVGAESRTTFTGVSTGDVLVEATGRTTNEIVRERVHVDADAPTLVVLEDPRGTVRVTNSTGEPLVPEGALSRQHKRIEASASAAFTLPVGPKFLVFAGADSGVGYSQTVAVPSGETVEWDIGVAQGHVGISNRLEHTVALTIDGEPAGELAPGGAVTLGPLAAGDHRLAAQDVETGLVVQVMRRLQPSGLTQWTLSARPARLVVINGTDEALAMRVDGVAGGTVHPHSRKLFSGYGSGPHDVAFTGPDSGTVQSFRVELLPDEDVAIAVSRTTGTLIVDNASGEAIRLLIDGREILRLDADATGSTVVPAGGVLVEAVHEGSRLRTLHRLRVPADHAVSLVMSRPFARLVVVNRSHRELSAHIGDRRVGVLPPDGQVVLDDITPGMLRLWALDAEGQTTHSENRAVAAGETSTWVLTPAP